MDQLTAGRMEQAIERQVAAFSAFLRRHGFSSTVSESEAALKVLKSIPITRPETVVTYWQPIYAKTNDQWQRFPDLFDRYFYPESPRLKGREAVWEEQSAGLSASGTKTARPVLQFSERALLAYSPRWGGRVELSPDPRLDYAQMKPWTRKVLNHWAYPRGHRRKSPGGPEWDWRGTMNAAFRYGGDPALWVRQHRRKERCRVLGLVDVSGSMAPYVPFYLGLMWHLMRMGARVECFVSSNQMLRVTPGLQKSGPGGSPVADADRMGGGTRLGWAFTWLRQHYPLLITSKTTLLVASDGFDAGDLWMLAEAFSAIARTVRQVLWMNPLLLEPEYEPRSAAMQVVLPYCTRHVGVRDAKSWVDYAKNP